MFMIFPQFLKNLWTRTGSNIPVVQIREYQPYIPFDEIKDKLSTDGAPKLRNLLFSHIDRIKGLSRDKLVVEMKGATQISNAAIAVFDEASRVLIRYKKKIAFANMDPKFKNLFKLAGIIKYFEFLNGYNENDPREVLK